MHPFDAEKPPQLAVLLGYAGLVPFVGGALGIWVIPMGWRPFVLAALLDFAAVILAFMGAIHWGWRCGRRKPTRMPSCSWGSR